MQLLMSQRIQADQVDYADTRFIVCKTVGVKAGGMKFEMGDELPKGILSERALREIYDTPLRLIETFEWAVQDEGLLAAMMTRMPVVEDGDFDDDGETEPDDEEDTVGVSIPKAQEVKKPSTKGRRKS